MIPLDPTWLNSWASISKLQGCFSISFFNCYYFGLCSDRLAACLPSPVAWTRSTCQTSFAHIYCVELSNARINKYSDGFFPPTSHLWKLSPSFVFLASFNLPSFKRQVYHHPRDQLICFFVSQTFFYIYISMPFLGYFSNLFITCHSLPLHFPKGYRLEKGHNMPILCSYLYKKKKKYWT